MPGNCGPRSFCPAPCEPSMPTVNAISFAGSYPSGKKSPVSVAPIFSLSACQVLPLKSMPDVVPSASRVIPDFGIKGAGAPAPKGAGAATGAGAGAAAGAAAAVVPSPARCFKYSSKEGAAEMDLRGSSCWMVSGLRVSAIPPEPMCWFRAIALLLPLRTTVNGRPMEIGLKASAAANSNKLRAGERTLIVTRNYTLTSFNSIVMVPF
mmetsp:Transcript_5537/g.8113  ORF Transcript_5537/g.8113 Transcript_5537/m.8113 type:complete len:208 (+) Transcript_5537:651-1274(+)